jgi:hypothetical protein
MAIDDEVRGKIQADYRIVETELAELETARKEFRPDGDSDVVTCAIVVTPNYLTPEVDEGQQVPYDDKASLFQHYKTAQGCLRTALSDGIAPAGLLEKLEAVPDYVTNLSNAPSE